MIRTSTRPAPNYWIACDRPPGDLRDNSEMCRAAHLAVFHARAISKPPRLDVSRTFVTFIEDVLKAA